VERYGSTVPIPVGRPNHHTGIRNILHKVATEAEIEAYKLDTLCGDAGDVIPHTLQHSVVCWMMGIEEGNTVYDVQKESAVPIKPDNRTGLHVHDRI
jgi:hypothetical protein